ncbi:hypothetical protein ACIF6L_31975 [Kitasatospora sp. NPDC086009]|uniref:hypothetical protein n=1 Tax=unclassified Kitasatospora TaxID=2633591 RepID=UPI0037CA52AB
MNIQTTVAALTEDAEREIHDGAWVIKAGDRLLARKAADALTVAVDIPADRHSLPETMRLEGLREAIAALAITLARTHGHFA